MAIIILKALLAASLFIMLFFIIFYLGYKCAWNQGWDEGWDLGYQRGWDRGWNAREDGTCKGCVCYSFTVNALRDYYDEPFKDHDQHPFDYTEFDKYMDFVDEQVGKLKKEIEDDDL